MNPRWQNFWILQLSGWAVYAGGTLIGLLPRLRYRDAVAYELTFLVGVFVASFFLRLICRALFRRRLGWPKTMAWAVVASTLAAVPCGWIAESIYRSILHDSLGPATMFARALGGILYAAVVLVSWCGLYFGIKYYQLLELEHVRVEEAEALAREARLQVLRYQLAPHFLFNTLNSISTLIVEGRSAQANSMLGKLGSFLRSTLRDEPQAQIPLRQEIAQVRDYLAIEQARLGNRLKLEFSIDPDIADALVPALFLQPLVENAVYHGIAPQPAGGQVMIEAERDGPSLRVRILDNGVGRQTNRRGVGLANTLERFRVLYGARQRVHVRWPEAGGCVVELEFPYTAAMPMAKVGDHNDDGIGDSLHSIFPESRLPEDHALDK